MKYSGGNGFSVEYKFAVFAFIYTVIAALALQLFVLPLLPSLHAGDGLLKGSDYFAFHVRAVELLGQIHDTGFWNNIELRPRGQGSIAYATVIYMLTGISKPWIIIPFNAFLFALSVYFLVRSLINLVPVKIAIFSLLPLVLFPSSVMVYGQIHKDIFCLFSFSAIVYVYSKIYFQSITNKTVFFEVVLLTVLAGLSVWFVRPYLLKILLLGGGVILVGVALNFIVARTFGSYRELFTLAFVVFIFFAIDSLPTNAVKGFNVNIYDTKTAELDQKTANTQMVKGCNVDPGVFGLSLSDKLLSKLYDTRRRFMSNRSAGSNIDLDVNYCTWTDLVLYTPKALLVGLAAPFPNTWLSEGKSNGGSIKKALSSIEMTVAYFSFFGFLGLLWVRGAKFKFIFSCLTISVLTIFVYSLVVTNVGTLYRMRFAPLHIIISLGICGWYYLYKFKTNKFCL
ncbi:hypothetical protein [Neptuniibacter sp. QD48_11]|uniref:hypothetical protein n=1 Tax=unclassified Neptuniibacter TaxID=2630693 RepID=UPI0039F5B470